MSASEFGDLVDQEAHVVAKYLLDVFTLQEQPQNKLQYFCAYTRVNMNNKSRSRVIDDVMLNYTRKRSKYSLVKLMSKLVPKQQQSSIKKWSTLLQEHQRCNNNIIRCLATSG